jgi:membrane-bound lytic murein transglycosylase B
MSCKFKLIFYLIICLITLSSCTTVQLNQRSDTQQFVAQMSKKYNFNQNELTTLFQQVKIQKNILATMEAPYEEQPWYVYKEHLITKQRVNDGLSYWHKHARALRYAEKHYGVPASIIVAIIGIESNYGTVKFKYRAIDALATLSFYYPKRAAFFKQELTEYLLLTRQMEANPLAFYGSYAGALCIPQFMPSTWRRFAVSYQSERAPDLNRDSDAIVSIANFLKQKGWQTRHTIAVRVKAPYRTISGVHSVAQFAKYGAIAPRAISRKDLALPIELQNKKSQEYWLGLNNFRVLMKYNPRINYAMAVYELAKSLTN